MTATRYAITLAFPVRDMKEWSSCTKLCCELATPGVCTGSGTGLGLRDMQFEFQTRAERDAAKQRLYESGIAFEYINAENLKDVDA